MIDVFLEEEMEAPCPCDKCGGWFDLHTGRSLPGSNVIICRECYDTSTSSPKGKERKDLRRDDIVWSENDTASGESWATHGYYASNCHDFGDTHYDTAVPLCNSSARVGDGSEFLSIDEIKHNSEYKYACKRCQKIFDKLPY